MSLVSKSVDQMHINFIEVLATTLPAGFFESVE